SSTAGISTRRSRLPNGFLWPGEARSRFGRSSRSPACRAGRCRVRKVIYSMNMSLDGFVAGPDGELDWAIVDEELHRHFNDEVRAGDAFLYGRRMYELMARYWPTVDADPAAPDFIVEFARIWKDKPKIVFSKTLERVEWNSRLVRDDVGEEVARLKAQPG